MQYLQYYGWKKTKRTAVLRPDASRAGCLLPSCSLPSRQNEKTCSCFIFQQNRVTQSPSIHICPNISVPYRSLLWKLSIKQSARLTSLLVEQPDLSSASKLSHVPLPPNTPVVSSCSSFKFQVKFDFLRKAFPGLQTRFPSPIHPSLDIMYCLHSTITTHNSAHFCLLL